MKASELIAKHDGAMTPEFAAQLLDAADGDTGLTDSEEMPAPAEQPEKDAQEPDIDSLTPDTAVILAKDGKHTIGFDKLVEARETAKQAQARADAAEAELARLREEAQARKDAGQQATTADAQAAIAQQAIDEGVDPAIFGDFSEDALAKGIDQLTDIKVSRAVAKALAEFEAKQQQAQAQASQLSAQEAHEKAIYEAHPDADSIVESQEWAAWYDKLPSFQKAGVNQVMQSGSTQEVIDVFNAFKGVSTTQAGDARAKADQALAKAKPAIPASLSDFPGGATKGATAEDRARASENGVDLYEAMAEWSPDKIDEFLSRAI